ncbi:MAG: ATP-dependent DNA helicase RecG [Myxococcota bacterium]
MLRAKRAGPMSAFHQAATNLITALEALIGSSSSSRETDVATTGERCQEFCALAIPDDLRAPVRAVNQRLSAASSLLSKADREESFAVFADLRGLLTKWLHPTFAEGVLARSLGVLPGIGPKRAKLLGSRGLRTISDAMFYLPTRYDDRRALVEVCDLEVGRRATFIGEVKSISRQSLRMGGRFGQILEAVVGDETGSVTLKWFRMIESIEKSLERGALFLVTGDVKRYRFSKEIVHPELERIEAGPDAQEGEGEEPGEALRTIVPQYPTPEGIPPRTLAAVIRNAVEGYSDLVDSCLPNAVVAERNLPAPGFALRRVHAPDHHATLAEYENFRSPSHERLVLEELYLLELGLVLRRAARAGRPGIPIDVTSERVSAASQALPFALTGAQARVWREVQSDLARPHPMNRLLQGDVGSGKTAIALLAATAIAAAGKQCALMAPTELLAEQHARSLREMSKRSPKVLGLRIGLFTASVPKDEVKVSLAALAAGEIDLAVGTHALIQEKVVFHDLALAIIDEQHRFGVLQRAALAAGAKGNALPHSLVMTATPIPRTLALTGYGDLDLSIIDELPPGRSQTQTLKMQAGDGLRIMDIIRDTIGRGEQAYVVYPLVEESEKIDLRSAMESADRIAIAFPKLRVDLLHGRLDSARRSRIMDLFAKGETDILVATTVIEVGVDVANASLMIIEHAERFGLAQLHQLRGRVGRGAAAGTCVLVSRGGGKDASARIDAMLRTTDGFKIADADLEIRGPGEFLGTRQSGELVDLRMADLVRDAALVEVARDAAVAKVGEDPGLATSPRLLRAVETHWGERLALINVG